MENEWRSFRQGFGIDSNERQRERFLLLVWRMNGEVSGKGLVLVRVREREREHGPNLEPVCCLNRQGLGFRLSFWLWISRNDALLGSQGGGGTTFGA